MNKFWKRGLSSITIFSMVLTTVLSSIPVNATLTRSSTDTMAIGSYVQFGSYYGNPILWRVIHRDAYGTMIFMDKIITLKSFDASEPTNPDVKRQTNGSNNWSNSNLREWLNSNASTVTYSTQKPDATHVWTGYNPYDAEGGFLSNFTTNEQNAMVPTTHKYMIASTDAALKDGGSSYHIFNGTNPSTAVQNYDTASYKYTIDKVFPLSVKELNDYVYNNTALGDGATYYMGKPTTDAFSHTTYRTADSSFDPSSNWIYWLRDTYTGNSYVVRRVQFEAIGNNPSNVGISGIRGALYLKSGLFASGGDGTFVNPYTFFGVTTIANPLLDQYNNGDARDIRVIFNGTADESYVKEYRVMAVRTAVAGAFDTAAALALPSDRYDVESQKGKNRQHMFNLPQTLKDSESNGIIGGTSYTIFVLAVGKTGYSNTLTSLGTITLNTNNQGAKVEAATPILMDVANNNNGTDLRVTFKKSKSEANIQEYRIIASTATLDLNAANSVPAAGYKAVTPTNPRSSYVVTLGSSQKDQGGITAIQNGTSYKVYVLAVGKNGYTNVLSPASKAIMLSATVPGIPSVRGLRALYVGEGSDSSNIKVTFYEPVANSGVQEYRIFIAPAASTLDEGTAVSVASGRYQVVSPTRKGELHSVTLDIGLHDYTDTVLSTGTYKVYVLAVGKSGSASRLSAVSGSVTLP